MTAAARLCRLLQHFGPQPVLKANHSKHGAQHCNLCPSLCTLCPSLCTLSIHQHLQGRCKHNSVYWQGAPFYAFGLGAASLLQGQRFSRPRTMAAYRDWVLKQACHIPDPGVRCLEHTSHCHQRVLLDGNQQLTCLTCNVCGAIAL